MAMLAATARVQWRVGWVFLVSFSLCLIIVVLEWTRTSTFTPLATGSAPPATCSSVIAPLATCSSAIGKDSPHSSVVSPVSLSKELVIRRVYFDPRRRDRHNNSVVFLFESNREVNAKSFSGCRVGSYTTDKFHYRTPAIYGLFRGGNHRATEKFALIDCYDIPLPKTGDSASLFYTSFTSGLVVEAPSLQPLVVPEGKKHSTITVVTCLATVFMGLQSPAKDGMIYQWLRYQKTIGVDHVHMVVEDSFVRAGGFHEAYSLQAIEEGFLSIDFWDVWLNKSEIYKLQTLAYQDCLHRFQGVYDYIVYSDIDDFFVPLKHNKSIKHYLQTRCTGKISSCRFFWRQYYPDCGWDPASVGNDGNLTATVSYKRTVARTVSKSAHQLKGIIDVGPHNEMKRLPGYKGIDVPRSEAYFAHLRRKSHPPGRKGC